MPKVTQLSQMAELRARGSTPVHEFNIKRKSNTVYFVLFITFFILKAIELHGLEIRGGSLNGFFQQKLEDYLIERCT